MVRLDSALLLCAMVPTASASIGACGPVEQDTNYNGQDVHAGWPNISSLEACCDMCSQQKECLYFTYRADKQLCHPKYSASGRTSTKGSVSGASKNAPTCSPVENSTNYNGNDIDGGVGWQNVGSLEACCDLCNSEPQCAFFTYRADLQICHPKSSDVGRRTSGKAISGAAQNAPPPKPPAPEGARNVLVIMVDDMRPELGPYGHKQIRTPHMDSLAEDATVFERAYVQQTVCSPSRNSFMSGRHPDQTRTWNFLDDFRNSHNLNTSVVPVHANWSSMPEYFKNRGYQVYGTGKTYHPNQPLHNDLPRSWDGYDGGDHDPSCQVQMDKTKNTTTGQGYQWFPIVACEQNHAELIVVNSTLKWIDASLAATPKRPFFIAMGLHKPHLPWQAPKRFFDQYDAPLGLPVAKFQDPPAGMPGVAWHPYFDQLKPSDHVTPPEKHHFLRKGYYGAVSYTDHNIGTVLDHLKAKGIYDDTVVVVWGDHGWSLGEHNLWEKKSLFENDARVPLIVKAPGIAAAKGAHTRALAETVDIYPTVVELAGLQLPAKGASVTDDPDADLGGQSLVPVLKDPKGATVRAHAFTQFPRCDCGYTSDEDICTGGVCDNCTQKSIPCDEHVCLFIPRTKFTWMGYSVRSDGWRYTEWLEWNGLEERPYWDRVKGRELYPHQEYDGESDFDLENENLASHPEYANVTSTLSRAIKEHWMRFNKQRIDEQKQVSVV